MDKDRVLPLAPCVCGLTHNEYCAGCEARLEQRDADWERVAPLLEEAYSLTLLLQGLEFDPIVRMRDHAGVFLVRDRIAQILAQLQEVKP